MTSLETPSAEAEEETPSTETNTTRRHLSSPALQRLHRSMQEEAVATSLCGGEQEDATVDLEGFEDTAAVEAALADIMSGAVTVEVDENTSANETLCSADTTLQMVPADQATPLDDGAGNKAESGKPSNLAGIVIGVVFAAVGVLLVLVFVVVMRRHRAGNASAVHPR